MTNRLVSADAMVWLLMGYEASSKLTVICNFIRIYIQYYATENPSDDWGHQDMQ